MKIKLFGNEVEFQALGQLRGANRHQAMWRGMVFALDTSKRGCEIETQIAHGAWIKTAGPSAQAAADHLCVMIRELRTQLEMLSALPSESTRVDSAKPAP